MMRVLFALLSVLLLTMPVKADWQFTKWGDSVEATLAHKVEDMHATTKSEEDSNSIERVGRALARSAYASTEFKTVATYLFRDGKLSGVDLEFQSQEDAWRAMDALKSQYGRPLSSREGMPHGCSQFYYEWADTERSNIVAFNLHQCRNGPVSSSVLYTPLQTAGKSGL